MALNAKLCIGSVVHRRYRPTVHGLQYRVVSLLVDLDDLEDLSSRSRLFSYNRSNLFSLHAKDHGDGAGDNLKGTILGKIRAENPQVQIERVQMLCFPRVLGYVFNPLTVYYCYGSDDQLAFIVYEVNNTFGDRHHYVLPLEEPPVAAAGQSCLKKMYVSPFNTVEGTYEFHISPPEEPLAVGVNLRVDGLPVLKAYLHARTEALTDRALLKAFMRMPAMSFKVIAAIHWEALRLWLKGLRIVKRPKHLPALHPLSINKQK